ncbi:MAG TPA: methyltransferase domain-containing protein [Hanamia sp.]
MIDYKKRSSQKEILDQKNIPFADIALNMKELDWINSRLGGHAITIAGFRELVKSQKSISVCEIGCGGGDNLNALYQFCIKNNITAKFVGIDINKECVAFAKEKSLIKNAEFILDDYKNVHFEKEKPDIIFSSLFCHHFSDNQLKEMVKWMKENSTIGFFINDLHRHPVAYHFIKMATNFFSKSYLVKNDASISVLRGFKKDEWRNILENAGIKNYSIDWKWAFRFLIVVFNSQNSG